MPRSLFVLALLAMLSACAETRTRLVVVVYGEPGSPPLTGLVIRTLDAGGSMRDQRMLTLGGTDGHRFPVSFVVEPRDPSREVRLVVEGLDASGVRIVRSARTTVPAASTRVLRLELEQCCMGMTSCGEGMTCIGGTCASDAVSPSELLALPDGAELHLDASVGACLPPSDAGPSDAGLADSGAPDDSGGTCAPGCVCEQACAGATCSCVSGCGCTLSCASGATCTDIECAGSRTTCEVPASEASNLAVGCQGGAHCEIDGTRASNVDVQCRNVGTTCEVDCTGASNCEVRCRDGAQCLLQCSGDNCQMMCQGSSLTDCTGGVFVCGRGCP